MKSGIGEDSRRRVDFLPATVGEFLSSRQSNPSKSNPSQNLNALSPTRYNSPVKSSEGGWGEFEEWVTELRAEFGGRDTSPLVYRGQGDSTWPLATTLERAGYKNMLLREFCDLIQAKIGPAVASLTGFDVPEFNPDYVTKAFLDPELIFRSKFPPMELYPYMVYLRHHGFPSPFLDWSKSPYVAAFFAFREDPLETIEKRSVYTYCESPHGMKVGAIQEPSIRRVGSYVRSHRRHFRQQSDYTFCARFDENYGWRFDAHEEVFNQSNPKQDIIWKFDFPSSERVNVLRVLDDFNLNAFSLSIQRRRYWKQCGFASGFQSRSDRERYDTGKAHSLCDGIKRPRKGGPASPDLFAGWGARDEVG